LGLILRRAAGLTFAGILAGLAGSLAGTRLINGLLFHTSGADPVAIVLAAGTLMSVSLLAALIPAFKAASVSPTQALRSE
jgi:ABC-type antimicrobial peptide transport system permease subunit